MLVVKDAAIDILRGLNDIKQAADRLIHIDEATAIGHVCAHPTCMPWIPIADQLGANPASACGMQQDLADANPQTSTGQHDCGS